MLAITRLATLEDIPAIKAIADADKQMLGFVNRTALAQSAERGGLYVVEIDSQIAAFANLWHRRDGWHTVMEIAVAKAYRRQGVGRALISSLPKPLRLKCTVDNGPGSAFYQSCGFLIHSQHPGKSRMLNEWRLT